jgi:hypothetical protein
VQSPLPDTLIGTNDAGEADGCAAARPWRRSPVSYLRRTGWSSLLQVFRKRIS